MGKKKKNRKPIGLKITRNGESFTFSWNNGDKYSGLKLQYAIKYSGKTSYAAWEPKKWKSFANHKTTKWSKKFSGQSNSTYTAIKFKVSGKYKDKWYTSKDASYDIKPPDKPTFSLAFNNDFNDPAITLSWTVKKDNASNKWFYAVGYKTRLVDNNGTGQGEDWTGMVYDTAASKSITIREDPNKVFKPPYYVKTSDTNVNPNKKYYIKIGENDYERVKIPKDSEVATLYYEYVVGSSFKREVTLIAYGPGGSTSGGTKSYVYAKPNIPVITDEDEKGAELTLSNTDVGYICDVAWKSNRSDNHPLDSEEIQYLITVPRYDSDNNRLTIPSGQLSWTTAGVYHGSSGALKQTKITANTKKYKKKQTKKKRFVKNKSPKTVKAAIPSERMYFEIDQLLPNDNVVFTRIINKRSSSTLDTPSAPVLCEYEYDISSPTDIDYTLAPSGNNNKISISATNNCQIEESFLAISYCPPNFNKTLDTVVNPDKLYYIKEQSGNYKRVAEPKTSEISSYYEYTAPGEDEKNTIHIGYILPSEASPKVIEIPNNADTFSIGVCALVGKISTPKRNTTLEYNSYDFSNAVLESDTTWIEGQTMPKPPTNITLEKASDTSIHVAWDWDWKEANAADISWSDDINAWESTNEPSTYRLDNLVDGSWYISGLSAGNTYYVRIRLIKIGDGNIEYTSRWSTNDKSLFLSTQPLTPTLEVSPSFINPGGKFTATWVYVTNDNTAQADATLRLDNEAKAPTISAGTRQTLEVDTSRYNWTAGTSKLISVQVRSEKGIVSEWSEKVKLPIISPLTCLVTLVTGQNAGFTSVSETYDVEDDDGSTYEDVRVYYALQKYPFSIQVSGSGVGGTVRVYIERWGKYLQPGPDENDFVGYDNEIVYSKVLENVAANTNTITINRGDINLIGSLDDGGTYIVRSEVEDNYGQTDSNSASFVVDWDHKAYEPSATISYVTKDVYVEADDVTSTNFNKKKYDLYIHSNNQYISAKNMSYSSLTTYYYKEIEGPVAKIQSYAVSGAVSGDVLDIYRLSVDKPELIYQGGAFNEIYIDPYPTIGDYGGYRMVFRTKYDDYIKADGEGQSWVDYSPSSENAPGFDPGYTIINFDNDEIHLMYNIDLSSSWNKDFTETKYLGGSVQGDWNPAVSRTGTISSTVITDDTDTIEDLRRLAVYAGSCHIRTSDGSNYEANIDVSENMPYKNYYNPDGDIVKMVTYNLNITRIDNDSLDGVLYEDWINE